MSAVVDAIVEVRQQPIVCQVEGPRVFPVMFRNLLQAFDDIVVAHFDGEYATTIEAPRGEVDRSDDRRGIVGDHDLPVELRCFSLWTLMPTSSMIRSPPLM